MKKNVLVIIVLLVNSIGFSQQIGDGVAPDIDDFTLPLKSGMYCGINATGMVPDLSYSGWQHLLVNRHANLNNNHQLQIASSFAVNDRLFFRKIVASDLSANNTTWIELATRNANTFSGDQVVNGGISSISSGDIGGHLSMVNNSKTAAGTAVRWSIYNMSGHYGNSLQFWAYDNLGCAGGLCDSRFTIMDNGNIGIGKAYPKNKLDVDGTIHSKEVKVDMLDWSDFVFKKEYKLPTLTEVEKHINEKGHLENIPSEAEVLKNGINLGEMNAKLLQKIEELTLYSIKQSKEIELLKEENKSFKTLADRLSKIEQKIK